MALLRYCCWKVTAAIADGVFLPAVQGIIPDFGDILTAVEGVIVVADEVSAAAVRDITAINKNFGFLPPWIALLLLLIEFLLLLIELLLLLIELLLMLIELLLLLIELLLLLIELFAIVD